MLLLTPTYYSDRLGTRTTGPLQLRENISRQSGCSKKYCTYVILCPFIYNILGDECRRIELSNGVISTVLLKMEGPPLHLRQ